MTQREGHVCRRARHSVRTERPADSEALELDDLALTRMSNNSMSLEQRVGEVMFLPWSPFCKQWNIPGAYGREKLNETVFWKASLEAKCGGQIGG